MPQAFVSSNMNGAINNNNNQLRMQLNPRRLDILKDFFEKVPVETLYQMCPIGQDGKARTDRNRARLMVAKSRNVSPTAVNEN